MIRRCAWCGSTTGEDHREPVGVITDGCCEECVKTVLAENATKLAEAIDDEKEVTQT